MLVEVSIYSLAQGFGQEKNSCLCESYRSRLAALRGLFDAHRNLNAVAADNEVDASREPKVLAITDHSVCKTNWRFGFKEEYSRTCHSDKEMPGMPALLCMLLEARLMFR